MQVAITDGGNGLGRVLRQNVSDALQFVLDSWHEAERLHKFAALGHAGDSTAAAARAKSILWEEGGAALLRHVRGLRLPAGADPGLAEELRRRIDSYEANAHRADYPGCRAKGWDVGSGPTEAGCKVLQGRLKGTGMRWG